MYTKFTNGEAEISAKDPMMIRTLQSMGFREVGTAKATGATPASPATPPETPTTNPPQDPANTETGADNDGTEGEGENPASNS
jgi:hypothetical protein